MVEKRGILEAHGYVGHGRGHMALQAQRVSFRLSFLRPSEKSAIILPPNHGHPQTPNNKSLCIGAILTIRGLRLLIVRGR